MQAVTELDASKIISERRQDILRIAAAHGATNVRVFGSFARGTATQDSDIDLLVDLEANRSLIDLTRLIAELSAALGRNVDVVTSDGLYWLIRRRVLREARAL